MQRLSQKAEAVPGRAATAMAAINSEADFAKHTFVPVKALRDRKLSHSESLALGRLLAISQRIEAALEAQLETQRPDVRFNSAS
jgi:hypothetical protein